MNRGIEQGGKYPWETDGEMPSTSRPSFRSRDVIPNVIARAKVGRTDPAGPLQEDAFPKFIEKWPSSNLFTLSTPI